MSKSESVIASLIGEALFFALAALVSQWVPGSVVGWATVIAAVVVPLWGLTSLEKERRRCLREREIARGLCLSCGYDARACQTRCSECGAVFSREIGAQG